MSQRFLLSAQQQGPINDLGEDSTENTL